MVVMVDAEPMRPAGMALNATNNHADRERLTKSARHAQDDRGHERGRGALEHNVPDGLPAGVAQGERTLTVAIGHRAQRVDRKGRDRGENHKGKHDGARQNTQTQVDIENHADRTNDDVETDETEDNRGDTHQQLDKRLEVLLAKHGRDLHHVDGGANGNGHRDHG